MKNVILPAMAALAIGFSGSLAATDKLQQIPQPLQQQIPQLMKQTAVPGLAIAKIENGSIAWQAAFGQRAPGEPVTTNTVFNVASLTKPVFATLVLQLVASNQLKLDEQLASYWIDPDLTEDKRHQQLTAQILLSHQSGLPNWRGSNKLAFMFTPGDRHEYSGEGFEYLRRALEHKTDQPMPALMQQHILQPAGISQMYFGWQPELADHIASGFNEAGDPMDTGLQHRQPNAAANLMATAGGYARFLAWIVNGAALPTELMQQMASPQALHNNPAERFGLGWKLIPLSNEEALMHDGREPGVRTYAIALPQSKQALVILTNSSNGELIFRPLIKAALSNGAGILQSTDRLVWDYLNHLPPHALVPMSQGIARSPSYLSTLLHAVNTVLIQRSELPEADKANAARQIDNYVLALLNGTIESSQAQALIERLLYKKDDQLHFRSNFDKHAAQEWLKALQQI